MIRGIHHVAISSPDLDRLVAFYRDVIGAEVVREGAWPIGSDRIDALVGLERSSARSVILLIGNAFLEIFQYDTPTPASQEPNRPVNNHGYTHFCLDVVDIDAEYERLLAAGMTFHCPPPALGEIGSGTLRSTYGRDPDGNVIELQELFAPGHPLTLPGI